MACILKSDFFLLQRNFDQALVYHVMLRGVMNACLLKAWHVPNHGV